MMAGSLAAHADDFPYLTFETTDGTKTSVGSSSLTITIQDGKLMVGAKVFSLADLSKMYFSVTDVTDTAGLEEVSIAALDNTAEIYDLQGRKVSKEMMKHGIYVIKTKKGTRKVNVR